MQTCRCVAFPCYQCFPAGDTPLAPHTCLHVFLCYLVIRLCELSSVFVDLPCSADIMVVAVAASANSATTIRAWLGLVCWTCLRVRSEHRNFRDDGLGQSCVNSQCLRTKKAASRGQQRAQQPRSIQPRTQARLQSQPTELC